MTLLEINRDKYWIRLRCIYYLFGIRTRVNLQGSLHTLLGVYTETTHHANYQSVYGLEIKLINCITLVRNILRKKPTLVMTIPIYWQINNSKVSHLNHLQHLEQESSVFRLLRVLRDRASSRTVNPENASFVIDSYVFFTIIVIVSISQPILKHLDNNGYNSLSNVMLPKEAISEFY